MKQRETFGDEGFLAGTSEVVIAGILDVIANDLNITLSAAKQLVTVFSLVCALGTPLLVAATARIERKTLLMITLLIFAFGNFLPVFSRGIWGLWASRVILAVRAGVLTVAALTLAAHLSPPERRSGAICISWRFKFQPLSTRKLAIPLLH